MEVHHSAIMDHVAKENHTIDWEGVTFPTRNNDWTATGVKEAGKTNSIGAHIMDRDGIHHQLFCW